MFKRIGSNVSRLAPFGRKVTTFLVKIKKKKIKKS